MKTLVIYCAGGIGREAADLANRVNDIYRTWNNIIFVDDNLDTPSINNIPVMRFDSLLKSYSNVSIQIIITSGEPFVRETLYNKVRKAKFELINLMHPEFLKSDYTHFGVGNLVHTGAIITCNIEIGDNNLINKQAVIGHDVRIGNHCVISPHVTIGGSAIVENNVFIGSGATIKNGVVIGKDSIVGMGAVITKDIPENMVVVGNPGRILRENKGKKVFK